MITSRAPLVLGELFERSLERSRTGAQCARPQVTEDRSEHDEQQRPAEQREHAVRVPQGRDQCHHAEGEAEQRVGHRTDRPDQ